MGKKIDIKQELERQLGPEYISFRNCGYTEEPYIEGWTAVQMANRIFGYNGWSSQVLSVQTVDAEDLPDNRSTISAQAHIRITLKDGIIREDIGFGVAERVNGKGKAIKQAYKSAVTDGIKRALKQFGRAMGSCCNDKNYIRQIRKIRKIDTPIKESELIRPGSKPYTKPEINPKISVGRKGSFIKELEATENKSNKFEGKKITGDKAANKSLLSLDDLLSE
ncbi:DNA repair and recombination protein RAD52 [Nematocida ausubeli]|nr:DNA repair and recombination protein RAD52 [Nematocida ausubeli]KAI5162794.1 DNA repair and recombination protein RAD52 [Nematocida ausubeli]